MFYSKTSYHVTCPSCSKDFIIVMQNWGNVTWVINQNYLCLNCNTMNELKLNQEGILHGKRVRCVEYTKTEGCIDCAFLEDRRYCNVVHCLASNHSSGKSVIYLPVEK